MRARPEGYAPYLDHDGLTLYQGHALELIRAVPDRSIDACFTSPPFMGLREYGTEPLVWGGDPACEHAWGSERVVSVNSNYNEDFDERWGQGSGQRKQERAKPKEINQGQFCQRCGAWLGSLGLEPSLFLYLDHLVEIFREVRRVLKPWGVLLLEIGDSYASKARGSAQSRLTNPGTTQKASAASLRKDGQRHRGKDSGIKEKDRMGVPHRLVFALVDDGWHWPGEIIWHRNNPMPNSTNRRCTDAHSMIFQLAKSGKPTFWTHRDLPGSLRRPEPDHRWVHRRTGEESAEPREGEWRRLNLWAGDDYYWDAAAIAEPTVNDERRSGRIGRYQNRAMAKGGDGTAPKKVHGASAPTRNARSVWSIPTEPHGFGLCAVCHAFWTRNAPDEHCGAETLGHFAAFPVALAERALRAASSECGVCGVCGAPWTRAVEKGEPELAANTWSPNGAGGYDLGAGGWVAREPGTTTLKHVRATVTTGWRPTCACGTAPVPSVILDPFCGSGTVLVAARRLGRAAVGLELNDDYCEITGRRLAVPDVIERAAETSEEPVQLVLGSGE